MKALADDKSDYRVHRDRRPMWTRMLEELGTASVGVWTEFIGIVGFFGAMIVAFVTQIRARRRIRWHAIVTRFQSVGVDPLPHIGLMAFLIGLVLPHHGAGQPPDRKSA